MLQRRHGHGFRVRWALRNGGEGGIFCLDPAQESAALLGVRSDHSNVSRRWEQRHRRRVDDLKHVEAKGMSGDRRGQKPGDGQLAAPRSFPFENEAAV